MKSKTWKTNIEVINSQDMPLKNILVWNYDMGDYIEVIFHYISYKNTDKRGIGQWNIKLKSEL